MYRNGSKVGDDVLRLQIREAVTTMGALRARQKYVEHMSRLRLCNHSFAYFVVRLQRLQGAQHQTRDLSFSVAPLAGKDRPD